MNSLKLSDAAIAQVAQLLQIAILTGTDIVDNLRQLELVNVDGSLEPSPDFTEMFENNIQKMMEEVAGGDTEESANE